MWINPFPIIWRSEPVRLELPADGRPALDRVRDRLHGWSPRTWFKDGCRGSVTDTRLRVKRYRLHHRRSNTGPVLDAGITMSGRTALIVGVYRTAWVERVFLTLWFTLVILAIPAGLVAAWSFAPKSDWIGALEFGLGPTALLLSGRAIFAVNQRHWDADKDYVTRFLAESLATPPAR